MPELGIRYFFSGEYLVMEAGVGLSSIDFRYEQIYGNVEEYEHIHKLNMGCKYVNHQSNGCMHYRYPTVVFNKI